MLEVQFGQATDPGKVRTNNEDAMGFFIPVSRLQARSHGYLFAVADGVGGTDLGEVASSKALQVLVDGFDKAPAGTMLIGLLPRLIQQANAAVHDCTLAPEYRGKSMGTTLVACAMRHDQAIVSHVGDSRCYLFRNGHGGPLTRDHTVADEQIRLGILSPSEAAEGDGRSLLTRSLGQELFVAADTITVNIMPGDILLLCSDGLHGYVSDAEIQQIVASAPSLDQAAAALVAAANAAGGYDNVSVQLVRVRSVERMGLYRGRPYRLL